MTALLVTFPEEIKDEIFKWAALLNPGDGATLSSISKRIQTIVERIIYRNLLFIYQDENCLPRLDRVYVDKFMSTLQSRPADFFARHVHNIFLVHDIPQFFAQSLLAALEYMQIYLECEPSFSPEDGVWKRNLDTVVSTAPNLRLLVIMVDGNEESAVIESWAGGLEGSLTVEIIDLDDVDGPRIIDRCQLRYDNLWKPELESHLYKSNFKVCKKFGIANWPFTEFVHRAWRMLIRMMRMMRYILDNRESTSGKDLKIASDMVGWDYLSETFTKVTGTPSVHKRLTLDQWFECFTGAHCPIANEKQEGDGSMMIRQSFSGFWCLSRDDILKRDMEWVRSIHPKGYTLESWMRSTGYTGRTSSAALKNAEDGKGRLLPNQAVTVML